MDDFLFSERDFNQSHDAFQHFKNTYNRLFGVERRHTLGILIFSSLLFTGLIDILRTDSFVGSSTRGSGVV